MRGAERARGFHQKFNNPLRSPRRAVDEGWMTATRTSRQWTGSRPSKRVGGIVLVVMGGLILGVEAILLMLLVGLSGFDPGASRNLHQWSTFFAWALIAVLFIALGIVRGASHQHLDELAQRRMAGRRPTVAWSLIVLLGCLVAVAIGFASKPAAVIGTAALSTGLGLAFIDSTRGRLTRVAASVLATSGLAVVTIKVLSLYMA
jgi:hypothetical protein